MYIYYENMYIMLEFDSYINSNLTSKKKILKHFLFLFFISKSESI